MIENPFKNLKINNYYSYLLVLGGVLLLFALFYESNIISQQKLALISVATIVLGILAWIRESHYNERMAQLHIDWQRFYESQPMRGTESMMDSGYELKLLKKFLKENNAENALAKYHTLTWILLIIYFASIVYILIFL
jgi:hypothetical protein